MRPPRLSEQLLTWALPEELKDPILGDLEEEFSYRQSINANQAISWYRRQAIKSSWQFIQKTKRGLLMLLLSLLIFFGFTIMAMFFAGDPTMFMDIPSVLIVVPVAFAFTIAASSWQHFKSAFSHLFSEEVNIDSKQLKISQQVFTMLGNISLWLGGAMTVMGWIAIASNLDDIAAFQYAFAVSILTVLYAMLIKVLCYFAAQRIQFKLLQSEE